MFNDIRYAIYRLFFKTIGQTSTAIRMCFEYGLTSGKTLDYIYKNQPSGTFGIGIVFDKLFLNDPGWVAVRIRRQHLESLMVSSIHDLKEKREKISILDVASGPGSYILSVIQKVGEENLFARCRDYDARWSEEGKAAAEKLNLHSVLFEQGDAFNAEQILSLHPKPNVAVSSGFYDWFNDDNLVKQSMKIIYDALQPGGYFILSVQSNNRRLKLIEAVFLDFNHEALKMTMRPVETIQSWLRILGFDVQETLTDANNFYSVIKAQKPLKSEV
ncbi:MAG: class I SAM-dependent methyltransferase family protein [Gammaproteobacteria bacterium]